MLADAALQFAGRRGTSARVRACRDRTPDFDAEVFNEMAQLGWLAILVPEADGGLGGTLSEMGQLAYEWGATSGPEPLTATGVLAIQLLVRSTGPARDALLQAAMEGTALPAVAFVDEGGRCERVGDGWKASGNARFVVPADASDFLLVYPQGSGLPCLRMRAGVAGCTVQRERRVDGTAAARLSLDSVALSNSDLLGEGKAADEAAEFARDSALVIAAVQMSGTMRTLNTLTQDYLRTRTQFGKPIGSFQALQHKAVDMHIAEQLARDVAQNACATIDAGCTASERACIASRAKARACESVDRIARMAVQLHGAIGFTDEYDLSLHVNRALVLSAWLGNAQEHVRRYARHAAPFEAAYA
ncbi:MAG: acyl-CoA dehydrogenase [Ramlibacter sp.]|nr:acyl-CoA dehydrogenase [Ramlibacter sp.]